MFQSLKAIDNDPVSTITSIEFGTDKDVCNAKDGLYKNVWHQVWHDTKEIFSGRAFS